MITDPAYFLENNILKECIWRENNLKIVDKSIRHLMTLPFKTVFFQEGGGGVAKKKILENYRSYNTSPGFDDTFIVIIIMKFAHHI